MLKRIWDFISQQNRAPLIVFTFGFTWFCLCDTIMYFTPVSALDRYEGIVTSFTLIPYKCSGNKRYGYSICHKVEIKLNTSSKVFKLSSQQKYEEDIPDISVNDTVVIYTKHWYQWILTPGRWNAICQIQKGNEIYYHFESKKFTYGMGMFMCGLLAIVFWIFFIVEVYTEKNVRKKFANAKSPVITLRLNQE